MQHNIGVSTMVRSDGVTKKQLHKEYMRTSRKNKSLCTEKIYGKKY